MTVMLDAAALDGVLGMRDAIDLLEEMSRHEAAGRAFISPRLNTTFAGGWMRVMFAADYQAGYCATKAYHMIQGVGVRYVVSLYRLRDGELLAVLDGRRINSCLTLAVMHDGARLTTIEGLASTEALHPLQAAFVKHDAFQCGYCTPGQICSAAGLAAEHRASSRDEIREHMSGNLCRCGAYPNILAAIEEALPVLRGQEGAQ